MVKVFEQIQRILNPLAHAIKHGMIVGKGCTLASKRNSSFGSEPYLIKLGDEVRMSGGIHFVTHDGGTWAFRDLEEYKIRGGDIATYGSISIGDRTFIGYGVTILPNVKIGKRCIIGAGAIVTSDIPDNSIAVGIPAKVIGNTFDYANKCKLRHEKIGYDMQRLQKDKKKYLIELRDNNLI